MSLRARQILPELATAFFSTLAKVLFGQRLRRGSTVDVGASSLGSRAFREQWLLDLAQRNRKSVPNVTWLPPARMASSPLISTCCRLLKPPVAAVNPK